MPAAGYRLVSYATGHDHTMRAGILLGDKVTDARAVLGRDACSVLGILRHWDSACERLDRCDGIRDAVPLDSVTLAAPLLYPGTLFCAGANYWDHLREMSEFVRQMTGKLPSIEKAAEPWFFIKTSAGSIVGPGADVRLPSFSKAVDWEAELGVVIGRPTRNVPESRAMDAIAGYLVVNDLSARDLMKREGSPFVYDWIGQKCFADAAPMGPWLTLAREVKDPENLAIRLSVNGVVKQDSNTGQMVHSIAEQIAYLSRHVELQPGDVIATGTPAGVGMPKAEFLNVGDEVAVEIEGLGVLKNRIVADSSVNTM
jgi:2-keto-4-pentenoate hydratase/2-oxohepta-3-ene-1,7-dioic acid hydratase in catechol pathway